MHTHLVVREDALEIFGFLSEEELELFKLLISVSGIGPRSALGVLALDAPEKLVHAIGKGDVGYLTKVSGVGKKSAEKIVLEIRDKVSLLSFDDTPISGGEEETLEVLLALGYRREEAREALRAISSDLETRDERIKEALKLLSVRL
jgi:Holliday junction DNA helicase RuvA